ncbi:High-affinity branched-chain amino acid transport system permease protein LivH [Paenibacillus konkukensis]|uniref:High-affinity branched-chain amino acid transport system permease protein LivH n=1 Tax=Paenibacillus konkukensis TaxID=2020716 RepID=A0ABY4RVP4_9BACL|nr:urea ABC transporter permease subunit UrtB [Paenibacillus konkukensis]UQZ86177.1 High-affinity branched-chain amino acid transport system permease protein LivH [Paenibacillus konkukensis]
MSIVLLQLFNGLSLSSILLLIALGLAITFGLMNVINMAHGEFIMIGAYMAYTIQQLFQKFLPASAFGWYFVLSLGVAFAVAFAVGWLLEALLIRFLYGRPLDSLLATWGVSLVLQQLAREIFGAPNVAVKAPEWLEGGLAVTADLMLPYKRLFIIGLVIVCIAIIYVYQYHTRGGRNMQAVMQNRGMASCLGISTRRVDAQAFAFGSGMAGIAGCALTLIGPIGPTIGTNYIVDAFMVVVLGGIGKIVGTIAGALGIGVLNTAFEYSTSATIGKVIVFTLIIAFLQWRPSGLVTIKSRALD